jgi:hypothetical protein
MSGITKPHCAPRHDPGLSATEAIVAETVSACEKRYGSRLSGVVLTGSLARDEGSVLVGQDFCRLLGDAELFLLFRKDSVAPPSGELRELSESISASLARRRIFCRVDLAGVDRRYLRKLPRHILSYELRESGRVVFGDPETLRCVPEFPPAAIQKEDAWRLLSNRMVEWLEALAGAPGSGQEPCLELFYATVKLWMDAATSLLVFLDCYEPNYRARAERLAVLAADKVSAPLLPFPLDELADGAQAATLWKLSPEPAMVQSVGWEFCRCARRQAAQLWSWELAQLTGLDPGLPPMALAQHWARSCGTKGRWRGWLRAVRECGWKYSLTHCAHWLSLARTGSPRHWIYAVTAECMFREGDFSPTSSEDTASASWIRDVHRFLPMPTTHGSDCNCTWRSLARELAWNYHVLVEKSRA